ncbi:urea ABC transporter ATP-binding protein UrtD [Rhodovibrio sodomensis]|uniref:Urea ABC transporter ATP-binding protein UrtD n=1 Tax=Rhodovibrio sodomensis TaxID=1088 RepID=A0ABS1D9R6_9PROT|nr:urea ABC transporter ATP-binding protein UrtD [Rhodovibrio sodomensis]MBK1667168.1 urea ABC transporter ATP-binding protein UrtD [Rhodovibrio sodomensis]
MAEAETPTARAADKLGAFAKAAKPGAAKGEPVKAAKGTLLYLDGITVSFDGFKALDTLSLVVEEGDLRTIIGPNGAGKTTMMDVITGKTRPDVGTALFDGRHDLTQLREEATANLGVGRKFQKPTVFEPLSVFQNLELALASERGLLATLRFRLDPGRRARIDEILDVCGLGDLRATPAGQLSHGQKQWLEIGMLLIQDARLLLLDEPVAGMTDEETAKTARLIHDIKRRHTLIVVEHDMAFVRELGARTTVLHQGTVLTEGSVDAVQNDPKVIEVYLGR